MEALTKEDKLLIAQLQDRAKQSAGRDVPARSDFLDMHERAVAEQAVREMGLPGAIFWGGYPEAERQLCLFLPEYVDRESLGRAEAAYRPLTLLKVKAQATGVLGHRDYLGALLGLGIRRAVIGDILVREDGADILVLTEMADYLRENFIKAGRVSLSAEAAFPAELRLAEQQGELLRDTVASLRLDSVLAGAFRLSRGTAQEAISRGLVSLNGLECLKPDAEVREGDRISFRGKGRAVLREVGGRSKKDRIGIVIERF